MLIVNEAPQGYTVYATLLQANSGSAVGFANLHCACYVDPERSGQVGACFFLVIYGLPLLVQEESIAGAELQNIIHRLPPCLSHHPRNLPRRSCACSRLRCTGQRSDGTEKSSPISPMAATPLLHTRLATLSTSRSPTLDAYLGWIPTATWNWGFAGIIIFAKRSGSM